jgi:hypothetical protein
MTDQDIIDFFIDKDRNQIIEAKVSKKYLENKALEYKKYLDTRYNEPFDKYSEVITRIYYKIDNRPTCKNCGKPLKFRGFKQPYGKWCNTKCQLTDPEFIKWRNSVIDYETANKKAKQTCLEKYGNPNYRNTEKFKQTCLEKYGVEHAMQHDYIKEKVKQTCLEKYGVENVYQAEEIKSKCKHVKLERYGDEHYVNKEKIKQTCLERYGVDCYLKTNNENLKRGSIENKEKVKQTCLEKYGVEHYFQSDDWKEKNRQSCLEKYGVECYSSTDEYKERLYNSKKKNKTFNTSKIEKSLEQYFIENNINFINQYKSELYPYACDFYFPETDSYIEIQGNWTHGGHPFNENNEDDLELLKSWKSKNTKYYDNAIKNWTILDVEKRNCAKNNNLNYFEYFTIDFQTIINDLKDKNII